MYKMSTGEARNADKTLAFSMENQEILSTADKTKRCLLMGHLYDPLNNTEKQTILGCNFNGRSKEGRIMWWDINRLNLKYHNRFHR